MGELEYIQAIIISLFAYYQNMKLDYVPPFGNEDDDGRRSFLSHTPTMSMKPSPLGLVLPSSIWVPQI